MTLAERFRALGPQGQILIAIGVALALTVIIGLAFWWTRPRYETLFTDLRTNDAATIVAELDEQGIAYRLADGGTTILVHKNEVETTRLHIASADLPLRGAVGFELFNRSDMGLTEFAQRINYQRALQGELARTIMTIDSVEFARVHLTITEPTVFRADRQPPKASVTLTARPGRTITQESIQGIRRLVAASVSDLDVSNVVIMDQSGIASGGEASSADVTADIQQVRAIEQFYASRVRQALQTPYPAARVEVLAPYDQWSGLTGEADDERSSVLALWTPDHRLFRLDVRVISQRPFTPDDQAAIVQLVRQATGGEFPGDRVGFERSESPPPVDQTPATVIEDGAVSSAPARSWLSSPAQTWSAILYLALVVLVSAALAFYLRRPKGGRLSPAQRTAFARRLARLLKEDDVSRIA